MVSLKCLCRCSEGCRTVVILLLYTYEHKDQTGSTVSTRWLLEASHLSTAQPIQYCWAQRKETHAQRHHGHWALIKMRACVRLRAKGAILAVWTFKPLRVQTFGFKRVNSNSHESQKYYRCIIHVLWKFLLQAVSYIAVRKEIDVYFAHIVSKKVSNSYLLTFCLAII